MNFTQYYCFFIYDYNHLQTKKTGLIFQFFHKKNYLCMLT